MSVAFECIIDLSPQSSRVDASRGPFRDFAVAISKTRCDLKLSSAPVLIASFLFSRQGVVAPAAGNLEF